MPKIVRCKGNTTMTDSKDGSMTIHLSICNFTSQTRSVTSTTNYDSAGALRFTVTVVMVYGVAVVGVFALGLLNRKKRNKEHDDKEAQMFIKDYDNVRHAFEQKSRVGAVSSLLHNIHIPQGENRIAVKSDGLLTNLALFALPLPKIKEGNESVSDSQEDGISLPSSVGEEEAALLCVFCHNAINEQVGPLCNNCVNRYKHSHRNGDVEGQSGHGQSYKENHLILANRYDRLFAIESEGSVCSSEAEDTPILFGDKLTLSESGDEYYDVQNEAKCLDTEDDSPVLDTEDDSPALDTEADSPALDTEDNSPTLSTEAGSPPLDTEADSPALGTEDDSPTLDTEADSPALDTEAGSPPLDTEADSPAFEGQK